MQLTVEQAARAQQSERMFNAPLAQVYAAFSNPDLLACWWGPDGFTNTFREFDLRTGGWWRFTMHGPDGSDYPNESQFTEVIPEQRVVIEHGSGHHFFLTLEWQAVADQTRVEWCQLFDTAEHYHAIRDFVSVANAQNLDRWQAVVESHRSAT